MTVTTVTLPSKTPTPAPLAIRLAVRAWQVRLSSGVVAVQPKVFCAPILSDLRISALQACRG